MKKIISILIFSIIAVSCTQHEAQTFYSADDEIIPITQRSVSKPPPPPVEVKEVIKKKIIKDGRIGIEVKDLNSTKHLIDSLVNKYDGYYASEKLNNSDWEISYNLTIRIPSKYFEILISDIETSNGKIKYKQIDARDVTDQFIDLEARLSNKKHYLKKYNELLNKAKTVKDILEIEENIRGLEEEIESTTGRLKYLGDLVEYSTLNLKIIKPLDNKYQIEISDKFSTRIKFALYKGWIGFINFIVFIIKIWPFWIIATLLTYLFKRFIKRRKQSKK